MHHLQTQSPQINWQFDKELAPLSYFKIGGKADIYALIDNEASLISAVSYCHDRALNYVVLGGITNMIIPDEGYRGVVLHYIGQDLIFDEKSDLVYAGAGWKMAPLVQKLMAAGRGGLESFMSLPGSLGGAIYNNSHFRKEYVATSLKTIRVFNPQSSQIYDLNQSECNFAYDSSCFHREDLVILGAFLCLEKIDPKVAMEKAKVAAQWRLERQPLNLPSSGCIFQNVPNDDHLRALFPEFAEAELFPVGFLIDKAGLKGMTVGAAQVSEKHAAFIVNIGGAKAADVIELIKIIKNVIWTKFKVKINEEVFYLK